MSGRTPWDLSTARFAIYYAPPEAGRWWDEGSRWLGRDAITGRFLDAPKVPGLSCTVHDATVDARRYGWHGTLKAPMRLAPGARLGDLREVALAVAARHGPFTLAMRPGVLPAGSGQRSDFAGFVALCPGAGATPVDALAEDCVRAFETLRAPLTDAETAKRRAQSLSSRQGEYLAAWGYPFVFDEFRFHMTLSDRVGTSDAAAIVDWWQPRVHTLGPMCVDSLAIFVEPAPGAPFVLHERFALGGTA
ncbi:DUF1045 domain-containing protein [Pandoraea pnomenusa]|uniref:DUF1045 domain-containing protein n=1 Tax=Pandoraea pnomenusa TaxID=93220 RepID=UPI0011985B4E|nr:DUF1045 domain-containing protein [Pandoraea pnomenusa]QDX20213.1 DUF1045 domain-containing protein [Pandoraea pnomenusa]